MGMFSPKTPVANETLKRLSKEVERLSVTVAELRGTQEGLTKTSTLNNQVNKLRDEIAELKREKGVQEREIEHKLGLHRTQIEHERELLADRHKLDVEKTKLELGQTNLATEQKAFEKELKFRTERFEAEVGYVKDILGQILERLPDVNVAIGGKAENGKSSEKE